MNIYLCHKDYIKGSEDAVRNFCIDYVHKHVMDPNVTNVIDKLRADTIRRTPKGKPYFPTISNIHFSISHSGNIWAMAVDSWPLGFDIELSSRFNLKENESWLKIAKRFFTRDEYKYVQEEGRGAFLKIWVRKEAYMKYIGEGLSLGLDKAEMIDNNMLVNALHDAWVEVVYLGDEIEAAYCSGSKRIIKEIIDYRKYN